jgi:hypothetical protein
VAEAAVVTTPAADLVNVTEQQPVATQNSTPLPVSPVAAEQTSHKVTRLQDDIFPDMVWEDEITDLLASAPSPPAATAAAAPAPAASVPLILAPAEPPQPQLPDPEPAASAASARSKKDKSPRRQKAKSKSPAPKSIAAQTQAADVAAETAAAQADSSHNSLSPHIVPVPGPTLTSDLPAVPTESVVEPQPQPPVVPAETIPASSPPADSPPPPSPSPPQQAAANDVSSVNVLGPQSQKSKRKKNKSRSEDEPVIKNVSSPAVSSAPAAAASAPSVEPQHSLVKDIKQIREQISQTLVSNVSFFSSSAFCVLLQMLFLIFSQADGVSCKCILISLFMLPFPGYLFLADAGGCSMFFTGSHCLSECLHEIAILL